MPLNKTTGNMYSWTTHTHSHLRGECIHNCSYCYVKHGRAARYYTGPLHIAEKELDVNYGYGKTIFMEHCNDLFAQGVPTRTITSVLSHAKRYTGNVYVWQTKNPEGYTEFMDWFDNNSLLGTTTETNRDTSSFSDAPHPLARMKAMNLLRNKRLFITIEPIMDFDIDILLSCIQQVKPEFINIGADSKGNKLPEPSFDKAIALLDGLKNMGIEVRQKTNLDRLMRDK